MPSVKEPTPPEKKRLKRGRRPGVKLKEYKKDRKPNERPNLRRFSVSVPSELDRIIRAIRAQCDIEYAKIFRQGLDEFVRMNRGKISPQTWAAYWAARHQVDDEEWGKE